jgi:hypothetical protein
MLQNGVHAKLPLWVNVYTTLIAAAIWKITFIAVPKETNPELFSTKAITWRRKAEIAPQQLTVVRQTACSSHGAGLTGCRRVRIVIDLAILTRLAFCKAFL